VLTSHFFSKLISPSLHCLHLNQLRTSHTYKQLLRLWILVVVIQWWITILLLMAIWHHTRQWDDGLASPNFRS
jgi:hypothetical protein